MYLRFLRNINRLRFRQDQHTGRLMRSVTLMLLALFVFAAFHEAAFILIEHVCAHADEHHGHEHKHEHDQSTCPFCFLIHTPVLVGLWVTALACFLLPQPHPIERRSAPVTRFFALQPDPRAPPIA